MKELKDIKKFGFGLMRLPKKDNVIDVEQVKVMVDKFLEAGFNYFDTAFVYGGSEDAIREALVERYPRESYFLATKNDAWSSKDREEAVAKFETSLKRTGAGYFDMYLLHNLGDPRTANYEKYDMWNFVKEKKEAGLVKHFGFSFHGLPDELEEILTKHPEVDFVQLQINYEDWERASIMSKGNLEVCKKHGKPVVVMEPVKGGCLADPIPSVKEIFEKADPNATPASWAIRFAASQEGVMVVLSGMSNLEQMDDNLKTMKDFKPLSEEEMKVIDDVRKAYAAADSIGCTGCNYCAKVCPMNINISESFKGYNEIHLYNNPDKGKGTFRFSLRNGRNKPSQCLKCGACEDSCPQHLPIRELLEKMVEEFETE